MQQLRSQAPGAAETVGERATENVGGTKGSLLQCSEKAEEASFNAV